MLEVVVKSGKLWVLSLVLSLPFLSACSDPMSDGKIHCFPHQRGRPHSAWEWTRDMNEDDMVTLSDVWLWMEWLFFLPGDYALRLMKRTDPEAWKFLELSDCGAYGSAVSGVPSLLVWLVVLRVIWMVLRVGRTKCFS